MNYYQELCLAPIFNLNRFRKTGFLCDVELKSVFSPEPVKVHSYVLASFSEFFTNIFQGEFQDNKSTTIEIELNPDNLFMKVIDWMYTGQLTFKNDELMPLYYISHFYNIPKLKEKLREEYQKLIKTNLLYFVVQLDNQGLNEGISLLYSDIARHLDQAESDDARQKLISELSSHLFCQQFPAVIEESVKINPSADKSRYVTWIDWFYGDYEGLNEEKEYLTNCVNQLGDSSVRNALHKGTHPWFLTK